MLRACARPPKAENRSPRSRSSHEKCAVAETAFPPPEAAEILAGTMTAQLIVGGALLRILERLVASATSLNFSSAFGSLETSGWYLRASLRYAVLDLLGLALRSTPITA